jgi:hypothetical protein
MVATYVGALLLDFVNIETLTCISILLFVVSIYPISKIETPKQEKSDIKLDLM